MRIANQKGLLPSDKIQSLRNDKQKGLSETTNGAPKGATKFYS